MYKKITKVIHMIFRKIFHFKKLYYLENDSNDDH